LHRQRRGGSHQWLWFISEPRVEAGATLPIGWVAVGDPAQYFSPDQHEQIWNVQKELDFPRYVFGVDRNSDGVVRQ